MENERLSRTLRLLILLQSGRKVNSKALADDLGCSRRSVFRDLKALEVAGVPYYYDEESERYLLRSDFLLPPVQLTLREASALSLLASQIGKRGQIPFTQEAWQAMMKIQSQLPSALREELSGLDRAVTAQMARSAARPGSMDGFETIQRAINACRKLRIVYESAKERTRNGDAFLLRGYAIYFSQRAWYVVGYSELHGDVRQFKLCRLESIDATDFLYTPPNGWTLDKWLGKAWRMVKGDKTFQVEIEFTGEHARTMADTLWHSTQKVTWRNDNSCVFQCEVAGLDEIVWWILGYGPHARVVKPVELQHRIAKLSGDVSRLYDMTNSNGSRPKSSTTRPSPRRRSMLA